MKKRSSKNVYNNIYGGKHCHMLVCKLSFDYDQYTYKRNHTFDYVTCFIFKILKQSLSSIHYEHFQWKENNCGRWINLVHYKIFADAYSIAYSKLFIFLFCFACSFFSFLFFFTKSYSNGLQQCNFLFFLLFITIRTTVTKILIMRLYKSKYIKTKYVPFFRSTMQSSAKFSKFIQIHRMTRIRHRGRRWIDWFNFYASLYRVITGTSRSFNLTSFIAWK